MPKGAQSSTREARSAVICVATERARRRGEESYSRTATTPDGGIAKGSAKSTALLWLVGKAGGGGGWAYDRVDELDLAALKLEHVKVEQRSGEHDKSDR